jgi:hypothetical protein
MFEIYPLLKAKQARMFSQLLSACPDMSILTALVCTYVATRKRSVYTIENWIADTRRICLMLLPERCESKKAT